MQWHVRNAKVSSKTYAGKLKDPRYNESPKVQAIVTTFETLLVYCKLPNKAPMAVEHWGCMKYPICAGKQGSKTISPTYAKMTDGQGIRARFRNPLARSPLTPSGLQFVAGRIHHFYRACSTTYFYHYYTYWSVTYDSVVVQIWWHDWITAPFVSVS